MPYHAKRRQFLIATAATALSAPAIIGSVAAQAGGQVVVATWPGAFLAAQRAHFFDPFEKQTGVRVVVAGDPGAARIKAMVESGNVEWDLAEVSAAEMLVLARQKLLEPIDYDIFPKAELELIVADVVKPYGIGALFVAQALACSTKAFPGAAHPRNWAQAWDLATFPGPRTITAMDYGFRPLEIPLLADGVAADKLYPLDVDRAFKALERLRPSVGKWAQRGMDPGELLARGEVVVANASTGRVLAMREQGAPIDMVFDQALLYPDYWVVPKGARNRANAMKLAQFATTAQAQAGFSRVYPNWSASVGASGMSDAG